MIEGDVVVTATGFDLSVLGDAQFEVDGKPLDFGQTINYRGMMFTGVPNLAWVFGYFRASWTLRRYRRRLRLPAAEPHGRAARKKVRWPCVPEDGHAAAQLDRSGELPIRAT